MVDKGDEEGSPNKVSCSDRPRVSSSRLKARGGEWAKLIG